MEQLISNGKEQSAPSTPAITLPKGGGAIRGIGEKSPPTRSPGRVR
jgi:hypothetical protein